MTAREFLAHAGVECTERNLYLLGWYLGKGGAHYVSFPDADIPAALEGSAEEPANFQEYVEDHFDTQGGENEMSERMIRPMTVFVTDESEVTKVEGGYFWRWYEPEEGEEFVPEVGAAEYFEGCGREDIAECIRTSIAYRYGHREPY